ncbi:MAG TPA: PH domain-containing protein [Longimicrobiaceae bacterium]|nr:PH domain-containing protein [Longimicrobiaceae bacterium]
MPVDRGAIDEQLREIGEGERWWEQREFRDLPHILHADEDIRGIVNGRLLGPRRPRVVPTGRWLVVATNLRLIFLKQERFGRKQVEVPLDQIVGMRHTSRLRGMQATIWTTQRRFRLRIPKAEAFRFLGALEAIISRPERHHQNVALPLSSWGPGMSRLAAVPGVSGLISTLTTLSPPDSVPSREFARLEATVERLENEVQRLREQVEFLENLAQERAGGILSLQDTSTET